MPRTRSSARPSTRRSRPGRIASILAAATLAAGAAPAYAWGPEGHAIIAEIAEARLTPSALATIHQLLKPEGHEHLDEIASWADAWSHEGHAETGPWHYVNIPVDAAGYDAGRDCADGNCVVVKLQHFAAILGDRNASAEDRAQALKFVVHFVGDIHQPLHCANHDDQGGNAVKLSYLGNDTNLHAVWDLGIIEAALGVQLGPNYAPDLAATQAEAQSLRPSISAEDAHLWAPIGLAARLDRVSVDWTDETHGLARGVYRDVPPQRDAGWDTAYQRTEWPVVETQLKRAGVRLAELLNEALL
jgi:hypothetical protein